MQLHFQVNAEIVNQLRERTSAASAADLGRDGLTLLNWATEQAKAGRQVMAVDRSGNHYIPVMPVLSQFPYAGE